MGGVLEGQMSRGRLKEFIPACMYKSSSTTGNNQKKMKGNARPCHKARDKKCGAPLHANCTHSKDTVPHPHPIRRNSTVSVVSSQSKSDSSVTSGPPRTLSSSTGPTCDGSPPSPASSPKLILPLIESIASPSDQYQWGFSSYPLSISLRAGPLSPAMLAGPQQANGDGTLAFDPSNSRTSLTPRTGLTPGTGLTPLIGDPCHSHPRLLIQR